MCLNTDTNWTWEKPNSMPHACFTAYCRLENVKCQYKLDADKIKYDCNIDTNRIWLRIPIEHGYTLNIEYGYKL